MKLNAESKLELQLLIIRQLSTCDELKERVTLDSELLEQLLFEKQRMEGGIVVKFPIWSGDFLSKIDLSEVSFENVVWNLTCLETYSEKKSQYDVNYDINYENTNAIIDFSKAYKIENRRLLHSCNFSGTDLSQNEINGDTYGFVIAACNFSNTGIRVTYDFSKSVNEHLRTAIRNGFFNNCYLNGKLISSEEKKNETLEKYSEMVDKYTDNILEAFQKAKK